MQLGRLGDVLLATPTLRALRQRYPAAHIAFIVRPEYVDVLKYNPHLNQVVEHHSPATTLRYLRHARFDLAVNLQHSNTTSLLLWAAAIPVRLAPTTGKARDRLATHAVRPQRAYSAHYRASILRVLGISEVLLDLQLPVPDADIRWASDWIQSRRGAARHVVAISPNATSLTRRWPASKWIGLADGLSALGWCVIVLWGPGEADLMREITSRSSAVAAPPSSILQLAALLANVDLCVGNCSGPRHVATSQKTPTLTLHGSTSVGGWTRPSNWHRALFTDLPCRPCNSGRCPIGVRCLEEIEVRRVVDAARSLVVLGPEPELTVPILPPRATSYRSWDMTENPDS